MPVFLSPIKLLMFSGSIPDFRDSFGILIAPTSWVWVDGTGVEPVWLAWKASFCIRSNNRRFSAWSRFRTGLSCSSDRRFHQISLPSSCSARKLLNRLYFLCGLTVLIIFFLSSHKKWEPFFFQAPTKILCCCPHHIPLCSPLKFIFLIIFRAWYGNTILIHDNIIKRCFRKIGAHEPRLLGQSVNIHKLCTHCSHLLFCSP